MGVTNTDLLKVATTVVARVLASKKHPAVTVQVDDHKPHDTEFNLTVVENCGTIKLQIEKRQKRIVVHILEQTGCLCHFGKMVAEKLAGTLTNTLNSTGKANAHG